MAESLCKYFGICGGCSLQHVDYKIQLEQKKSILEKCIRFKDILVFSGEEYGYRNRMDFIFHKEGIGLRKKKESNNIIDVEKCAISNEKINLLLKEVRENFVNPDYFDFLKKSGTFKHCIIRAVKEDSSVCFVLNSKSMRIKEAILEIRKFAEKTSSKNVIVSYTLPEEDSSFSCEYFVVKGSDLIKERLAGKTFFYSALGFFQNNSFVAEKMHEYCNKLLMSYETKNAYLLDLYGGVGTFGIINADLFKNLTIVESVKSCIDAANRNIKENNLGNIIAILLDAAKLKKIMLKGPLFVITDPPRSGMDEKTILELKKLKPEVIIYISCNVQQLGKDIPKFKDYKIKSSAMFDLFPQTRHIEAVVELCLR